MGNKYLLKSHRTSYARTIARNVARTIAMTIVLTTPLLIPACSSSPSQNSGGEDPEIESTPFQSQLSAEILPNDVEIEKDLSTLDQQNHRELKGNARTLGSNTSHSSATGTESNSSQSSKSPTSELQTDSSTDDSGDEPLSQGKLGQTEYVVKLGDTLMKISFKAYADPLRWREILQDNKNRIANPNALVSGTRLKLRCSQYAKIHKDGLAYLIKWKDSLSTISNQVYGVLSRWRSIQLNNPELIKNPNKIYAGFTLYYAPGKSSKTRQ